MLIMKIKTDMHKKQVSIKEESHYQTGRNYLVTVITQEIQMFMQEVLIMHAIVKISIGSLASYKVNMST